METPRVIKEEIIKRTAALREKSGLGQEEIAAELGITRNQYAKYENIYPDRATVIPFFIPTYPIFPNHCK